MRYSIAAVVCIGVGLLLFAWRPSPKTRAPADSFVGAERVNGELPRLWQVSAFSYLSEREQRVTNVSLQGRVWIADFIFTQCTTACPMLTSRMLLVQRALQGVHFVSFSVDPAHDTPAAMDAYAKQWNADRTTWTLLSTEPRALKDTLAGFGVVASPSDDPTNPIVHSSLFFLIDAEGWVRGVYNSQHSEALDRLQIDARVLSAAPASQPTAASYATLGCAGCHANTAIAPDLHNLLGREVTLTDGMRLVADQAYIKLSISNPNRQVVAGYQPLMPSYSLTPEQLDALVAEVVAMRSANAAPAVTAKLVVDPICKMTVRATPESIHLERNGETTYFCSEACRDAFARKR